jgi:hypothetical protein
MVFQLHAVACNFISFSSRTVRLPSFTFRSERFRECEAALTVPVSSELFGESAFAPGWPKARRALRQVA